jgi:DNA-binding transcriptional MerR regulator
MVLNESDIQTINEIVETRMEFKNEEIKKMLRHLHNDVENARRELEIIERKIEQFVYMLADYFHIPEEEYEKVINLSPELCGNLDEIYSPIDEVDKIMWEEHLRKEKENEEEF